jgi:bifunctional DNA-binding transcriptional regulator/antitoxin component of YhaV-PrlF toxin-antitoxin module
VKPQASKGTCGFSRQGRSFATVGLRYKRKRGNVGLMTATLTIDAAGQITLPEALKRVFGAEPGDRLRAEVSADRIEIVREIPVVSEGVLEKGVLVLPRLGVKMDVAAAVRAERDEQAERGLHR